ncbi:MAG: DUF4105 domain-containing protein [Bdellovibrionota bacterium]
MLIFDSWKQRLGATDISLIFASSYTNNPASMFGHTFLRVKRVQNGQEMPPLLSYTVNFAAETGSKGMLYTIKGLFGAYRAILNFSVLSKNPIQQLGVEGYLGIQFGLK